LKRDSSRTKSSKRRTDAASSRSANTASADAGRRPQEQRDMREIAALRKGADEIVHRRLPAVNHVGFGAVSGRHSRPVSALQSAPSRGAGANGASFRHRRRSRAQSPDGGTDVEPKIFYAVPCRPHRAGGVFGAGALAPAQADGIRTFNCVGGRGSVSCVSTWRRGITDPHIIPSPGRAPSRRSRGAAARQTLEARCRPIVRQDQFGVERYVYVAPGCEFGKYH